MYVNQLIDLPKDQLKYEIIRERLIQYQQRKREREGEHTGGFFGRQNNNNQSRQKQFKNKNKTYVKNKNQWCDYHKTAGHSNAQCFHQRDNSNNNKNGQQQQQNHSTQQRSSTSGSHGHVAYATVPDTMGRAYMFRGAFAIPQEFANIWLMDSGATDHTCTCKRRKTPLYCFS